MLVYGDRSRACDPRSILDNLDFASTSIESMAAGIERHSCIVGALIEAGELLQGLADAAFDESGCDEASPVVDAATAVVIALARQTAQSWRTNFDAAGAGAGSEVAKLKAMDLPPKITVKIPEGYAYYAVYPEAYLEAAARHSWTTTPCVVGLRSIGASLAAMVAVGAGAVDFITVRPHGHPFKRQVSLGPTLRRKIASAAEYAVVDEGPGLSGSSFGAVGDLIERDGAPGQRVRYFPSHNGGLGPMASQVHRTRWRTASKTVVEFDELFAGRLAGWFSELVGEPVEPLVDLSAGRWRCEFSSAPRYPQQERLKFMLRTKNAAFLLKFVGLGRIGEEKFRRAQCLHAAGFTPRPIGLRHGFLIEDWCEGAKPIDASVDRDRLVDLLGRYLGFRAGLPAADEEGASLAGLAEMAKVNTAEVFGHQPRVTPPDQRRVRRVHTDSRLNRWEWLALPDGRILKTDALDHDAAHDLVGCQDIAWDVAGAAVEFSLSDVEVARLCQTIEELSERAVDQALLDFYGICYPAFQTGLWSFAEDAAEEADKASITALRAVYRSSLQAALRRQSQAVAPGAQLDRRRGE